MSKKSPWNDSLSRFVSNYGMVFVLLLLCLWYSVVTWDEQRLTGSDAGEELATAILATDSTPGRVLIAVRDVDEDIALAETLAARLKDAGGTTVETVRGAPSYARAKLAELAQSQTKLDVLATSSVSDGWAVFEDLQTKFPAIGTVKRVSPRPYYWPNFLKAENLLNITNQIAVIAILAAGMTLVIITGGIDLSVGSLIALSAVLTTYLIRDFAGAETASGAGMVWCSLAGIALCGVIGAFSGLMVTVFSIAPFIVTLAMMLVASGMAYKLAEGQSIYQVPDSFQWLGIQADLYGIPNAVVLMLIIYAVVHVLMSHMSLGRYIYAVGGNAEAARLSGVPVRTTLMFVYTVCGALAGLGGVVMASQLKSGAPTYGQLAELKVIAAVVVGGTSLAGGSGRVLGTLIGAFIIAVIQNGMNLTGVGSYDQKVVLGLVVLGAVLLDKLKGWEWRRRGRTG